MPESSSPQTARAAGRPPKSTPVDLRAFAVDRLLAGLAQAREASRSLSIPPDHQAATVHLALIADITQAESSARTLRRALES